MQEPENSFQPKTNITKKYNKYYQVIPCTNYIILKHTNPFDKSNVFEFDNPKRKKFYAKLVNEFLKTNYKKFFSKVGLIQISVEAYDKKIIAEIFDAFKSKIRFIENTYEVSIFSDNFRADTKNYEYTRTINEKSYKVYYFTLWIDGYSQELLLELYKYFKPNADVIKIYYQQFLRQILYDCS